jgi:thiol-disulfide isomerase/thioredoxin
MKAILLIFFFVCCYQAEAQEDSLLFDIRKTQHIGTKVPDVKLLDTSGKSIMLSSFKGKILYLDFWSTSCGPCLKLFPAEEELIDELKHQQLDTTVLIIKICGDSKFDDWKKMIHKFNSSAINLFLDGKTFKLWRKFKIPNYPTYQLVSREFAYLGSDIFKPSSRAILYTLFRAQSNINFPESVREYMTYMQMLKSDKSSVPDWFLAWNEKQK